MDNNNPKIQTTVIVVTLLVLAGMVALMIGPKSNVPTKDLSPKLSEEETIAKYLEAAETIGDSSWVPLLLWGDMSRHVSLILKIVNEFKRQHPEWDVYDWRIEKREDTWDVRREILGLWLLHRPKESVKLEKE